MPREVNSNADSEGNLRVGIFYTLFDFTNFLFANTPKGATGSAVMFSLIQTAIENGLIHPYRYLIWLMKTAWTQACPRWIRSKPCCPEMTRQSAMRSK